MGASKSRERPDYFKQLQIYHLPDKNSVWATVWREAEKVMVGCAVHNLALEGRWGIHDVSISASLGCVCGGHCLIAPYFRMGI
jgi:hypothetical protein